MSRLMVIFAAVTAQAACIGVRSERIHVRDLAPAITGFDLLDPDLVFGVAPAPGARRAISTFELQRFAERAGLRLPDVPSVCVEVPMRTLSADEVLAAVTASVADSSARVEVVDFSRQPVPEGSLIADQSSAFSAAANPAAPILWRGWVRSGEQRRTAAWAHVFVRVPRTTLVAARDIRPGEIIGLGIVQSELRMASLSVAAGAPNQDSVIGKQARSLIRRGQEIRAGLLENPQIVRSGQAVDVAVTSGRFSLRFRALAESGARSGEWVKLRNLASGKPFRALAVEPGKAQLNLSQEIR